MAASCRANRWWSAKQNSSTTRDDSMSIYLGNFQIQRSAAKAFRRLLIDLTSQKLHSRLPPLLLLFFVFLTEVSCFAQVGIQPLGTYTSGPDNINLGNLGVHYDIPLFTRKERGSGTDVLVHFVYDGGPLNDGYNKNIAKFGGWRLLVGTSAAQSGHVDFESYPNPCAPSGGNPGGDGAITYYHYWVTDQTGYIHYFNFEAMEDSCQGLTLTQPSLPVAASDGSGYMLISANRTGYTIATPTGNQLACQYRSGLDDCTSTDTNGNNTHTFYLSDLEFSDPAGSYLSITPVGSYPIVVKYKDSNGNIQQVTVNYQGGYNVRDLADNGNDVVAKFPSSIQYPDGTSYSFQYEQSANDPGYYTGRLSSVTLPTGGTISYNYTDVTTSGCGPVGTYVSGITRTTADGNIQYTSTKTFNDSSCFTGTSTTSIGESTRFSSYNFVFNNYSPAYAFETSHSIYNGTSASGTPLESSSRCYNGTTSGCSTASVQRPITQIDTTTVRDGGAAFRIVQSLNASSLPTEIDEYDYGASSPTKKTLTQYANLGNYISDRVQSTTIKDGNDQTISQITYGYDEYSLSGTSGIPDHTSVSGARGNRTSEHVWLNTGGSIDTHWRYDDAGQIVGEQDARGNWTTLGYDSGTDSCLTSKIYPIQVNGSNLTESSSCDSYAGVLSTSTDFNGAVTSYSYDGMIRSTGSTITSSSNVVIAKTTIGYGTNAGHLTITTTHIATPSPDEVTTKTLDGYGRDLTTTLPDGSRVDTIYDSLGRAYSVSNPYFSNSDPTYGITIFGYDALNRMTSKQLPSIPNPHLYTYASNYVTETDERQIQWTRKYDLWQHVVQVNEPGSIITDYGYDLLGNLTSVNQHGTSSEAPRTRSFSYDSLSRLLTSTNPETGIVCYGIWSNSNCINGYDANGNLIAKTDTRGITTNYIYDALNRMTSKTYMGGVSTPSSCYQYDAGPSIGNFIGHLNSEWTKLGACDTAPPPSGIITRRSVIAYDGMGRVLQEQRCHLSKCVSGVPYNNTMRYDLAGNPTLFTNELHGIGLSQSYDMAGRLKKIESSLFDATHPALLFSVGSYAPFGGIQSVTLGTDVNITKTYDNMLRSTSLTATHP